MNTEILQIIGYLNLLELSLSNKLTKETVEKQYRTMSHIYHPDVSAKYYKDGKKFIQLKEAYNFVINNIDYVNKLIENNFSSEESINQSRNTFSTNCQNMKTTKQTSENYKVNNVNRKKLFISIGVVISIILLITTISLIIESTRHYCYYELTSKTEYCDKEGTALYKCTGCEKSYTRTLKAAGHNYIVSSQKEATCLTTGSTTYKCSKCKDTYMETIKATGHDSYYYGGEACRRCGQLSFICSNGDTLPLVVDTIFWTGDTVVQQLITSIKIDIQYNGGITATISGQKIYQYNSKYEFVSFRWQVRDSMNNVIAEGKVHKEGVYQGEYFTVISKSHSYSYVKETQYYVYILPGEYEGRS